MQSNNGGYRQVRGNRLYSTGKFVIQLLKIIKHFYWKEIQVECNQNGDHHFQDSKVTSIYLREQGEGQRPDGKKRGQSSEVPWIANTNSKNTSLRNLGRKVDLALWAASLTHSGHFNWRELGKWPKCFDMFNLLKNMQLDFIFMVFVSEYYTQKVIIKK